MTTTREFAHDADLTHPWVEAYRIPMVTTPWPRWRYEMALVVPSDDFGNYRATMPSETEAKIIGSAIDYRRAYYRAGYAAKMLERPLDVDDSVNTFILIRQDDDAPGGAGWRWRADSWEIGPHFAPNGTGQVAPPPTPQGLIDLLTRRVFGFSGDPDDRWIEHMAAHPEVFTDLAKVDS